MTIAAITLARLDNYIPISEAPEWVRDMFAKSPSMRNIDLVMMGYGSGCSVISVQRLAHYEEIVRIVHEGDAA